MIDFKLNDKFHTVWDLNEYHAWDSLNAYDASPDGLSGDKEGFYFGNWLLPFTIPIRFQSAIITPDHYPGCINKSPFPCKNCDFFSVDHCPIIEDQENIELSREAFRTYQQLVFIPKGNFNIFQSAFEELRLHGSPLNYKLLSRIVMARHPNIKVTDRQLLKILCSNPIFFADSGQGVFQMIPNRIPKFDSSILLNFLL